MKRLIYLTRHGQAGMLNGRTVCSGKLPDYSLNRNGREQAEQLALCMEGIPAQQVYCSTRKRSYETALIVSHNKQPVIQMEDLDEIGMGTWEGMDFDEIKARYPELYEARAENHALQPPGGEAYDAAASRMQEMLQRILKENDNQEAVVISSHCGANRALLCSLLGIPFSENRRIPQPYACINVLEESDSGLRPLAVGMPFDALPDQREINSMLDVFKVDREIREHMEAVAGLASEMNLKLNQAGVCLDENLIHCSALLHDMCRSSRGHERMAAMELRRRGYLRAARVVELHHGGEFSRNFDEGQLLFLADKMVCGTQRVSIEERFAMSLGKCRTQQARAAHAGRLLQTRQAAKKYESLLNGTEYTFFEHTPIVDEAVSHISWKIS